MRPSREDKTAALRRQMLQDVTTSLVAKMGKWSRRDYVMHYQRFTAVGQRGAALADLVRSAYTERFHEPMDNRRAG